MKKSVFVVLILILPILIAACAGANQPYSKYTENEDKEIVLSYLKDMKYEIIEERGLVEEFVVQREDLIKPPYQMLWGMQKVEPLDYIGKTIKVYGYVVKNHPLDNIEGNNKKQTNLWIMIEDGQMIGGHSYPEYDELMYGGFYSIDGKNLEEITKMDFQTWREKWVEKYK